MAPTDRSSPLTDRLPNAFDYSGDDSYVAAVTSTDDATQAPGALDLSAARSIIVAAFATAADDELAPLAAAVLDAGGHLIAFERQDGTSNKRFEIAHGKAFGGLGLGVGSRSLMTRAEQQPYFIAAAGAAIGGGLVPVPGGVLIRDRDNNIIGAVGISGDTSDNDEMVAVAAITSVGWVADPGS